MRPKKIVLCVDDNEQDLSILSFLLNTHGYHVVSATSGQDAVHIFASTSVDIVLSDFSMPQMNGDQLLRILKQIAPHIPMILLGDPQKMGDHLHAADAVLDKRSCTSEELLARVKQMSARKRGPRKGTPRVYHTPKVDVAACSGYDEGARVHPREVALAPARAS